MKWDQPFLFREADGIIDLAPAIEKAAHTTVDTHNQPAHYQQFRYSKHETHYRFDRDLQGDGFS